MSFRLLSLLPLFAFASAEEAAASGIPLVNGNLGLTGGGYGDVYGGKLSENVYGAGGRVGGELGLSSLLGLGSGRKKRQDFGFVPFASLNIAPPPAAAPAPSAATAAPAARRKRQTFTFPDFSKLFAQGTPSSFANAIATASGANATANASAISSVILAAPAPATTAAPGRKKRQVATANAFASASGDGAVANAAASAIAGNAPTATTAAPARKKRQDFGFVPFASLNVPGGAPVPAATAAPAAPAPTTVKPC